MAPIVPTVVDLSLNGPRWDAVISDVAGRCALSQSKTPAEGGGPTALAAWVAGPGPCVRCGGELPVRAGPAQAPGVGASEVPNARPGHRSADMVGCPMKWPLRANLAVTWN